MSNLSFVELEQFYSEAIVLLGELRDKKLLKKLPDDVSNRILGLLQQYGKANTENGKSGAGVPEFDTRRDGETVPSGAYTSSDISSFWWKGSVEVKGLFKGQKQVKCHCIANGPRLSFFAGPKKKPLKGQLVLTAASLIEIVPDGKKQGNVFSVTEMAYPVVTLRFSSVEEGLKWFETYKTSLTAADVVSILSGKEGGEDPLLYEALDDVQDETVPSADSRSATHSTGELSHSISFASEDMLGSESHASDGSFARSDSRHSGLLRTDSTGRNVSPLQPNSSEIVKEEDKTVVLEEDKTAVLEEDPAVSWGHFHYKDVYQTEWSFNLTRTVLPDKGLLSLQRGQLVLVKEQQNVDWWKVLDCRGNEGFVASCYLSLAYEL